MRNVVLSAGSPSSSRLSNRSIVSRPASAVSSRIARVLVAIGPRANVSVTSSPNAAAMPARGVTGGCGSSAALPPPMIHAVSAAVPMSATEPSARRSRGSSASSFCSSTKLAAAASRMSARCAGSSTDPGSPPPTPSVAPVRSASVFSRSTMRSTVARSTSPASTASVSARPNHCGGPGISRSRPALAAGAVLCVPNQSEITNPSKPHSSRRTVVSSHSCSLQYVPLRRLYALITPHAPPSTTAASNGTR